MMHHRSGGFWAFLAGLAVGLASTGYYFLGSGGRRRRDQAERRIDEMRDDIADRLQDAKEKTRDTYERIVDAAVDEYAAVRELTEAQIRELKSRLKSRWRQMLAYAERAAREAREELDDESRLF